MPDVFEARKVPTNSGEFGFLRIRSFVKNPADLGFRIPSANRGTAAERPHTRRPGQRRRADQRRRATPAIAHPSGNHARRRAVHLHGDDAAPLPAQFALENRHRRGSFALAFLFETSTRNRSRVLGTSSHFRSYCLQSYRPALLRAGGARDQRTVLQRNRYFHCWLSRSRHRDQTPGRHGNTGAGGANPFDHDLLRRMLSQAGRSVSRSPLKRLPNGSALHVAIRRTVMGRGTIRHDPGGFGSGPE